SPKHSLFGRTLIASQNFLDPKSYNTELLQDTGFSNGLSQSYALGSTYLVSPNTVQAFRMAVNRFTRHFKNVAPGELFNWCDIGVKIYCEPIITRINGMSITAGFPLSSGFIEGHK